MYILTFSHKVEPINQQKKVSFFVDLFLNLFLMFGPSVVVLVQPFSKRLFLIFGPTFFQKVVYNFTFAFLHITNMLV